MIFIFSSFNLDLKGTVEEKEITKSMDKLNIQQLPSGQAGSSLSNFKRKPVAIIVVGMAGGVNLLQKIYYYI